MKIFNTLQEYKAEAKIGDIITLGGNGYIDGLKSKCKADFFKVSSLESYSGFVYFKKYGGKKQFTTATQQKVKNTPANNKANDFSKIVGFFIMFFLVKLLRCW